MMIFIWLALTIILLTSILCLHVDSFLVINLKGDLCSSTSSRISTSVSRKFSSRLEERITGKNAIERDMEEDMLASKRMSSMGSSSRTHRIDFVSPLLDYGYPPAAKDLAVRQKKRQRLKSNDSQAKTIDNEKEKPILLYLPGFDGTYICPFIQFPELGTEFELWCMTIGMEDRTTYEELKTIVLDYLKTDLTIDDEQKILSSSATIGNTENSEINGGEEEIPQNENSSTNVSRLFNGWFGGNAKKNEQKKTGRPIYIAGESFGGILASDVALTLLTEQKEKNDVGDALVNLQGLVLINPATCYDRSQLATAGPQVAKTPFPFYFLSLFSQLVPLFTDEFSPEQLFLILQAKALPSVIDNPCREAYMGRVALSLPTKLEFMPPSTLSWRLNEWLQTGCAALRESSFAAFPNFRSLIVVGEKDKTLPSIAEAERLANKVMNTRKTQIHVVDGAGHASTCGSRLDLTAVIRNRFPELQKPATVKRSKKTKRPSNDKKETDDTELVSAATAAQTSDNVNTKRTSMKPEAQKGVGPNFGMEERYDKADIGLNPLLYWSKNNYQSVQRKTEERSIRVTKNQYSVPYKKSIYTVSD